MQGHRLFLDYKVICSTIHPSTLPRKPSANPLIDAYLKDVAFPHQQYPLRGRWKHCSLYPVSKLRWIMVNF